MLKRLFLITLFLISTSPKKYEIVGSENSEMLETLKKKNRNRNKLGRKKNLFSSL